VRRLVLVGTGAGTVAFIAWLVLPGARERRPEPAALQASPNAERVAAVAPQPIAGDTAPGSPAAPADLEREGRFERDLAARAESLLAHAVGAGRVVVRVRAELDWSQREETRESYDPDGQVERSEERITEPSGGARRGAAERTTARVEYEIAKQVTRAITPAGAVKRLSVAVLLDGKPSRPDGFEEAFTPWSVSELAQLEALAKQAVGFSSERGDELTITSAPFQGGRTAFSDPDLLALAADGVRYAAILGALGLLAFAAARSFGSSPAVEGLPMSAAELEAELLRREAQMDGSVRARPAADRALPEEIAMAVHAGGDRDAGASALRAWLSER
jgi:flagellar biosynthesis/type III secretory pathway M-ring protein FliF/YscJ